MTSGWPTVEIDPVMRLHALAAALPHAFVAERTYDVRFDELWSRIGDLEGAVPRWEGGVSSIRILARDGEQLVLEARGPLGGPALRFDAVLRPGWCIMRSRLAHVGMAATPVGDGQRTRFAHFEGLRWLGALGRPFARRNVLGDLDRLGALLEASRREGR